VIFAVLGVGRDPFKRRDRVIEANETLPGKQRRVAGSEIAGDRDLVESVINFLVVLDEAAFTNGRAKALAHLIETKKTDRVLPALPSRVIRVGKRLPIE